MKWMKAGTLDRPSICIWVEKAPKSEKIAEKWHFNFAHHIFCFPHIATSTLYNPFPPCSSCLPSSQPSLISVCSYLCFLVSTLCLSPSSPSRAYMRASSNSGFDFLLSQVSHREKAGGKTAILEDYKSEKIAQCHCLFQHIFCAWNTHLLKHTQKPLITNWNTELYQLYCDTCDSKKRKTPVMRVYACAREGVDIGNISFQNLGLWIACRSEISSHQNVHKKQHVVLMKTTRHFEENDTSFYAKQHVVLKKTSRRFIQKSPLMETKKKSSRHNLHKYKHNEDYWSTKAK